MLRRYGATGRARMLERLADELERSAARTTTATVDLTTAAERSGFTRGHLRRLIRTGSYAPLGTRQESPWSASQTSPGSPAVLLPIRARRPGPSGVTQLPTCSGAQCARSCSRGSRKPESPPRKIETAGSGGTSPPLPRLWGLHPRGIPPVRGLARLRLAIARRTAIQRLGARQAPTNYPRPLSEHDIAFTSSSN